MYRHRHGVVRVMVVALAVAVFPASVPFAAGADPIDDQRAEVERITDELEQLEEQSDILAEEYVQAIDEKERLDSEVAAAEERVAAKQAEVAQLRGELGEMAVRSFIGAGSNGLGPMFTASTEFTDDLQRDHLSRVALSEGTATTDELDQAVADLAAEQAALEEKRDDAAELAEEVAATKEATDEKHAEYEEARADAEAELGQLIKEEEERRARESYERMQREAEEEAARQAAAREQAAADDQATTASARRQRRQRSHRLRRWRWRGADRRAGTGSAQHPAGIVPSRHRGERGDDPGWGGLSLCRRRARRGVRLLRLDDVGLGAGRCGPPAPVRRASGLGGHTCRRRRRNRAT